MVIEGAKITAIEAGADVAEGDGTSVLDLHGYSLMPGIIGMHNHLFYIARPNLNASRKYEQPVLVPQMTFTAPTVGTSSNTRTFNASCDTPIALLLPAGRA